MTLDQAVAILEAERVLQKVGCNDPDCSKGSAWFNFVEQAVPVIKDTLFSNEFDDLHLVQDIRGFSVS